jgi:prevent-host-death family protein
MEIIMVNEVSAVQFRQKLGEMLNVVQYRHDSILIHRDGKPVAALIDANQFAELRRRQERFDQFRQKLVDAYKDVPFDDATAEIDAVAAQVRAEIHEESHVK